MRIKRILFYFVMLLLMLPAFAFSQSEQIKEYKVIKGDTLWDIAHKELQDPFLWPKIWKENPSINNPDRIYPDQSLKIPLYLIMREPAEELASEEPLDKEVAAVMAEPPKKESLSPMKVTPPLIHRNIYTTSGYLGTVETFAGTIDGHPSGRTLYGNNDVVYVKLSSEAKPGDRFYIFDALREVTHPVTGEKMGSIVEPVGVLVITKLEHGQVLGKIEQAFSDIVAGNFLNPYFEMTLPAVEQPFRRPDVSGYVVASRKLRFWSVTSDIVYIDRGSNDGLMPGDLIGSMSPSGTYNKPYNIPNGLLQVISTEKKTATALVVKVSENTADRLIIPGNVLIKAEENSGY